MPGTVDGGADVGERLTYPCQRPARKLGIKVSYPRRLIRRGGITALTRHTLPAVSAVLLLAGTPASPVNGTKTWNRPVCGANYVPVDLGEGGDGTVQRCIDAVAGTETAVAILPAGTANLLAANLEVPHDLAAAVQVGLHGDRRRLDTGSVNGERFTVMAGAGFDARMISAADRGIKGRLGRAAYLYAGARHLAARRVDATVEVDGKRFFQGKVSCVLAANVGKMLGGVEAFPKAQPDDGRLELGVVTARNPVQWAWTFGRLALGHPEESPFVDVTRGKKFRIRFGQKVRYELDGGARPATRKLRIEVHPGSITVCVPPGRRE